MIYIGADHRGYTLKEELKPYLDEAGLIYEDIGAMAIDPDDDFVDYAVEAVKHVLENSEANKAMLFCRNAVGMDIVANRFKGIRCVLGFDAEQVKLARNDDDVNVLALPAGFMNLEQAKAVVDVFLNTPFEGHERQKRRLLKVASL